MAPRSSFVCLAYRNNKGETSSALFTGELSVHHTRCQLAILLFCTIQSFICWEPVKSDTSDTNPNDTKRYQFPRNNQGPQTSNIQQKTPPQRNKEAHQTNVTTFSRFFLIFFDFQRKTLTSPGPQQLLLPQPAATFTKKKKKPGLYLYLQNTLKRISQVNLSQRRCWEQ